MAHGRFTRDGYRRVLEQVGQGTITARVTIDQKYAQDQHEELTYSHPSGGSAKYVTGPLLRNYRRYYRAIARHILEGGALAAFRSVAEDLSGSIERAAPVDHGYLRNSGHPQVIDNGSVVYDRSPRVHRLSEAEIREATRDES